MKQPVTALIVTHPVSYIESPALTPDASVAKPHRDCREDPAFEREIPDLLSFPEPQPVTPDPCPPSEETFHKTSGPRAVPRGVALVIRTPISSAYRLDFSPGRHECTDGQQPSSRSRVH
ncbi:hypothetical protein F1559_005187 [Cyanidiococcus yangmingshanensis]|uniref:Uncharacterized protein n=1 Tax=Cyanidiococcus yangmingshanensis TaxID=2690220 RepID=A0A7J7IMK2_9RHOD|nr:hypothetical protein F1559_005187 [Cyanidiococcus yangmingshanensis]